MARMTLRQQHPVTPEQLQAHKSRIARCRGAACLAELERVFGTAESNALERMIDGRTARRNANGEAVWSRKYAHYATGTVPDPSTVVRAEKAASALGRPTRLRYWRGHPVWALLAEPVIPLAAVRSIMAELPLAVREQLYYLSLIDPHGRQIRQEFSRNSTLRLRDLGTLDAFAGLLALAREGEILEDDPRQALPARCAFEILPRVLLENPPLMCRWQDLFDALKLGFWNRVYHGGAIFPEYTLANLEHGLEAHTNRLATPLPWSAGWLVADEDGLEGT